MENLDCMDAMMNDFLVEATILSDKSILLERDYPLGGDPAGDFLIPVKVIVLQSGVKTCVLGCRSSVIIPLSDFVSEYEIFSIRETNRIVILHKSISRDFMKIILKEV